MKGSVLPLERVLPRDQIGIASADGKKVFVVGSQPRGELLRWDSKTQQFAPYLSGLSIEGLDFSRDGAWVAYVTFPEGSLWRSLFASLGAGRMKG